MNPKFECVFWVEISVSEIEIFRVTKNAEVDFKVGYKMKTWPGICAPYNTENMLPLESGTFDDALDFVPNEAWLGFTSPKCLPEFYEAVCRKRDDLLAELNGSSWNNVGRKRKIKSRFINVDGTIIFPAWE